MSERDTSNDLVQNELDSAQLAEVGGGGDCGPTASVGTGGITVSGSPGSIGNSIVQVYEGMIEATSYAIERIATSLK